MLKRFPNLPWEDLGPDSTDRVDYPDFADLVAQKIEAGSENGQENGTRGILVCGSGQGMAMRANKYSHVRAALCWNTEVATLSRQHNNTNLLCLGERVMDWDECERIVKVFLETPFEGGRHAGRVEKISKKV